MTVLALLFVVSPSSPFAQSADHIPISFSLTEVQEAARQELERHRKRPSTYWCDPVDFDQDQIFELAKRIESGAITVESSVVSVQIRSEKPAIYRGSYSWYSKEKDVVEWVGEALGNEAHTVHFIIQGRGRSDAIITSEAGSFRLRTSLYSKNYLLCEFDPTYPGHKID